MRLLRLVFETRFALLTWPMIGLVAALLGAVLLPGLHQTMALIAFALGLIVALGLYDVTQSRHAILRNYPVAAHLRFVLEGIRPEMRQYFFEGDKDGAPYPRDKRAIVYQRAKKELDKRPFGTQLDVYQDEYEWLHHSLAPRPPVDPGAMRVQVGGYSCSLLNISAMSYGTLSPNAVRALYKGAKAGSAFLSPRH